MICVSENISAVTEASGRKTVGSSRWAIACLIGVEDGRRWRHGSAQCFTKGTLTCECASTMLRHWTHSSALLPSFGFRINVWSPVKISNAFGMFRAPRETLTERIWLTSMLSPPVYGKRRGCFTECYSHFIGSWRYLPNPCTRGELLTKWSTECATGGTSAICLSFPWVVPQLRVGCFRAGIPWPSPDGCTGNSPTVNIDNILIIPINYGENRR